MADCIFCKIVNNQTPCYKIYEDNSTLAFLDAYPVYKGHSLVIPKKHYENLNEITEEDLTAVVKTAKKVANLLKDKLKCDGVNLVQSNGRAASQIVMHFHIHVVPRFVNDGLNLWNHGEKQTFDLKKTHEEITN